MDILVTQERLWALKIGGKIMTFWEGRNMDFDPQKWGSGGHWDSPEALKIGIEKLDFFT